MREVNGLFIQAWNYNSKIQEHRVFVMQQLTDNFGS